MEGDPQVSKTYNHIAFKILEDDIGVYLEKIQSLGIEFRISRPRILGE